MKAIILTRVSTKMQEEGLSLLAQSNRLQDYADRKGLEIIKTFEIVESSTHGERKQFMEMIANGSAKLYYDTGKIKREKLISEDLKAIKLKKVICCFFKNVKKTKNHITLDELRKKIPPFYPPQFFKKLDENSDILKALLKLLK